MNEIIKELAKQADNGYTGIDDDDMGHAIVGNDAIAKFAELIVRECAQLAMTQLYSTSPADYNEMDPYYQGGDDTARAISGLILRTFGVEE